MRPVARFYIPDIDSLNGGRSLRGQLSCFPASTGVGKSHIAKYIGIRANVDDGLHILHFQLEGSEEEALNAYSGGLIAKNAFYYEKGKISDLEMKRFAGQVNLNATQITSGTVNAARIDVASLKASLITASNIEALTLNTKGRGNRPLLHRFRSVYGRNSKRCQTVNNPRLKITIHGTANQRPANITQAYTMQS